MGKGLLGQLGLGAPKAARDVAAEDAGDDPVMQQHDKIAQCVARIDDAAQKSELTTALAKLRSTHAAGRSLRDAAKQAALRKAELEAAARLMAKAQQSAAGPVQPAPPAAAQAATPPVAATRAPPQGILRRMADGQMFWEPNPAPSTWGTGSTPAPDDWMRSFLVFYGLAVDPAAGGAKDKCIFNSESSTIDAAADTLKAQAPLSGYEAGSGARSIAAQLLASQAAARNKPADGGGAKEIDKGGQALVDRINEVLKGKGKRDLAPQIGELSKLDMRALLAVMFKLKQTNTLEDFSGTSNLPDRIGAAVLTAKGEFDVPWAQVIARLSPQDREAIMERAPANADLYTGPGDKSDKAKSEIPTELAVGIVFVPKTVHRKVAGEGERRSVDDNVVQVQGSYTFKFHGKNKSGFEASPITVQGGFAYDEKTKKLTQQWMAGGQAQAVLSFFKEAVQVQAFVQALAGVTIAPGTTISAQIVFTGQLAAGGQVVLSHPSILGGNLKLILLPLQVSGTASAGKKDVITTDVSAGIGLQVSF
jgi:hypothetical protein